MIAAMAKPMITTVEMLQIIMMNTPITGDTMHDATRTIAHDRHAVHDTNFDVGHRQLVRSLPIS
jgi:hypothetical protein